MPIDAAVVALPHLSIISRGDDAELARILEIVDPMITVGNRGDLETTLTELLAIAGAHPAPKTLDLIGHSTAGKSLLSLGDWVIDATNATVTSFFRELAEQEVMPRLGVRAIRLLGSLTATTLEARATIATLAQILGVEVYGTTNLVYAAHFSTSGFRLERAHHLVSATELAGHDFDRQPRATGAPSDRVLDLDALPTSAAPSGPWPHRTVDDRVMADVLGLVSRRDGSTMPGLLALPTCELVFGGGRRLQILVDGALVRTSTGHVYPVEDARAMSALVARL